MLTKANIQESKIFSEKLKGKTLLGFFLELVLKLTLQRFSFGYDKMAA